MLWLSLWSLHAAVTFETAFPQKPERIADDCEDYRSCCNSRSSFAQGTDYQSCNGTGFDSTNCGDHSTRPGLSLRGHEETDGCARDAAHEDTADKSSAVHYQPDSDEERDGLDGESNLVSQG